MLLLRLRRGKLRHHQRGEAPRHIAVAQSLQHRQVFLPTSMFYHDVQLKRACGAGAGAIADQVLHM